MTAASSWRRTAILGAGLLALGACESVPGRVAEAPLQQTADVDLSPRVAGEIARGRQALGSGDLQSAQAAFTSALRGSPNNPEPAIGLAETYLALGDVDTAGRLFAAVAKAAGSGGRDPRLLQGRGLVALRQGKTDEAIDLLRQSVEADPALWRAWTGLGRAYAEQGNSRRAHDAFARAEKAAPSPAVVINDMGMLSLRDKNPAAALETFQRALAVDPGNATASANARIARAMMGEYDAAVAGAEREDLPNVLNNVGYIAIVNGDFEVADRLLRRAVEISPVYHAAAHANLNLLAQAMNGLPLPPDAAPQIAGSRAQPRRISHSSTGARDIRAANAALSRPSEKVASNLSGSAILANTGRGAAPRAAEPSGNTPTASRTMAPPAAPGDVLAYGFRWESPPTITDTTARRREAAASATRGSDSWSVLAAANTEPTALDSAPASGGTRGAPVDEPPRLLTRAGGPE